MNKIINNVRLHLVPIENLLQNNNIFQRFQLIFSNEYIRDIIFTQINYILYKYDKIKY